MAVCHFWVAGLDEVQPPPPGFVWLAQRVEKGQLVGEILACTGQPTPDARPESEDIWSLDDQLLAELEAREDVERGFDAYNAFTFADTADFAEPCERRVGIWEYAGGRIFPTCPSGRAPSSPAEEATEDEAEEESSDDVGFACFPETAVYKATRSCMLHTRRLVRAWHVRQHQLRAVEDSLCLPSLGAAEEGDERQPFAAKRREKRRIWFQRAQRVSADVFEVASFVCTAGTPVEKARFTLGETSRARVRTRTPIASVRQEVSSFSAEDELRWLELAERREAVVRLCEREFNGYFEMARGDYERVQSRAEVTRVSSEFFLAVQELAEPSLKMTITRALGPR
jgi:hypothetical protein